MFASLIESILSAMSAASVTNAVVTLLLAIFILSVIFVRKGIYPGLIHYTPNLLTSLGIFGTFVGIVIGLLHFDVNNIDGSIGPLLEGLKTAFVTSLVGMLLAIVFKSVDSAGVLAKRDEDKSIEYVGPEDIYAEIKGQRESLDKLTRVIAGNEDSTLISQIRLFRSDVQEQARAQQQRHEAFIAELWNKLDSFAEMLSKSATEQVIDALNQVIADFNRNLTEQFGENFKELNAAVEKLVIWQENYREQLGHMSEQYEEGVKAITETKEAVAHISEESKQIPATMADLKTLLETTQHQLAELEQHLEAFRDMRDRAVEAVPQIREQMDNMVTDVSTAVKDAGEQIMNASQAVNQAIVQGAEEFKNNVHRTNEGLTSASDQLANNSERIREQLDSTVSDINDQVRNMVSGLAEQSKEISKTLVDSNKELQTSTKEVQFQVTDSIEKMQKRLESTLEEIFQAQTRSMQTAFNAVEDELRKSVSTTGDAVNKQLEAIDNALQQELERVMNEMGRALTAISSRFTDDYTNLVSEMSRIVNTGNNLLRS